MTDTTMETRIRDIVVEEVFPHGREPIWRVLTSGELMGRWLMAPTGFEAIPGCEFTMQTTPAGSWDGVIHCRVLEVVAGERLVFAWKGGHEANVGYGAPLDTVVTFTLDAAEGGTRLRLVHSGFVMPRNESAYTGMSEGWTKVVGTVGAMAGDLH